MIKAFIFTTLSLSLISSSPAAASSHPAITGDPALGCHSVLEGRVTAELTSCGPLPAVRSENDPDRDWWRHVCPILAALAPGIPGIVAIMTDGDVIIAGVPTLNCPPYESA